MMLILNMRLWMWDRSVIRDVEIIFCGTLESAFWTFLLSIWDISFPWSYFSLQKVSFFLSYVVCSSQDNYVVGNMEWLVKQAATDWIPFSQQTSTGVYVICTQICAMLPSSFFPLTIFLCCAGCYLVSLKSAKVGGCQVLVIWIYSQSELWMILGEPCPQ